MKIKHLETLSEEVTGKNVTGFKFNTFLEHATANTAFGNDEVDYTKAQFKVFLKRDKETIPILNGNLKELLLESAFDNVLYKTILNGQVNKIVKAAASGISAQAWAWAFIDLQGIINLRRGDKLKIEAYLHDGYFANSSTSNSRVEVDVVEGVGVESFTPQIMTESIQANESNREYTLGNKVTDVTFINFDKKTDLDADSVVETFSIQTDKMQKYESLEEIASLQAFSAPNTDIAQRYNSARLIEGAVPHNDVTINITFNSSNVNTGKNYLVYRTFIASPEVIANAVAKESEHALENLEASLES